MLGKSNSQKRWQNMARQDHFAIRKLSIGAVSILLGVAFLASGQNVKADAVTDSSNIQKTKPTTYSDLNLFLKSHDDAKANRDKLTTKPATVNNNQTNIKQADTGLAVQTQTGRVHQGKWNNINVTYNDETQELTLQGGTEDTPAIMQNGEWLDSLSAFLPHVSGDRRTLKQITINGKIKVKGSARNLFSLWGNGDTPDDNLRFIEGLANLDTSEVTDMRYMFLGCNNLTSLDVSHFDTSNVTNMGMMFDDCPKLTSLNVSRFNTSKVTDMTGMFYNCWNLTNLDVSAFDTSKVTDMSSMFNGCWYLTSLDVSHFDTSKVTDMNNMFNCCGNLTSLNVSNFDTSNVTDMNGLFSVCYGLTSLDVSNFNTSKVTNMSGMFLKLWNLTNLDVSNFDTSKVTDMSDMFSECRNLLGLNVSNFDTSKVTEMWQMFMSCASLPILDLSHFNTSQVTNMNWMFGDCRSLTSLDVSHFDTSNVANMTTMFYNCWNLTSLDLSRFDTSKVTDMGDMFAGCPKLKQLSLGKKFKFLQKNGLKNLPGKWINWGVANQQLPKGTKQWTSEDFVKNYNGPTDYDTYVRLANIITVQYRDQNGNKIPNIADETQYGNIGDSLIDKTNPNSILSFKRKEISGYNFDHAEINGQKVDLADIKYTENPQILTLFYTKVNPDNNNTNDSNNTNGSNDSNSQNNPGNSNSIKIPVEFASNVALRHNAYLYDSDGKRANDVTFKAGSIITVYGNKNINGRKFYILIDENNNKKQYYVAVGNVKPVNRKLKHNAYVYNKYGQRIKKAGIFKKAKRLNTYGDPVTIRGHRYFIIDNGRFVKAGNFALKHPTKKVAAKANNTGNKTIMHNAYLYNNRGKRANKIIISAGSKINTLNLVKIKDRLYYKLEDSFYIVAGNINASKRKLKHNAYIYSQYGNRIGKKVLKKRKFVKTYGDAVSIKHKRYYITAKNKFVKKANFR